MTFVITATTFILAFRWALSFVSRCAQEADREVERQEDIEFGAWAR